MDERSVMLKKIAIDNHSVKYTSCRVKMLKFIRAEVPVEKDRNANDYACENEKKEYQVQY